MSGENTRNFIFLLVAILIAGSFGFVFTAEQCNATQGAGAAVQCSAEFLSVATDVGLLDQEAALTIKNTLFVVAASLVILLGLARFVRRDPADARLRARKFSTRLPRSWPRLTDHYPAHLVSGIQP